MRDIDEFIGQQRGQQIAPTTINRRLATIHTFYECMAAQDLNQIWPNPVNWRRHRVKTGYPLPRDASDQDVKRLFAVINDARDAAMFALMVGAGLRVGEVAQLRLSDLKTPQASEQLVQLRVRGKGNKERLVWLTPLWYGKIMAWLAIRPVTDDEHLFLNQHGRGITKDGIQFRLKHYSAAAGINLTCHQLRHTFARRLADQRMPIESISKLLGHSFVTTTQRYTLGANPDLRTEFQAAMAQIDSIPPSTEGELPLTHESPDSRRKPEPADTARLNRELGRFNRLPEWLRSQLCSYAQERWHDWKLHMAPRYITRLTSQQFNTWTWLLEHRQLAGWADHRRPDVEAWLDARRLDGLAPASWYTELSDLRTFLRSCLKSNG